MDKKDVVTPVSYMRMVVEIMRHGDAIVPDYMLWLQKGNYIGSPQVTLFYGRGENLYAFAPSIVSALQRYHVLIS